VEVKVGIPVQASRATVKLGKKVTIAGAVSPVHTGSMVLTIRRRATVVLPATSVPLNGSLYSFLYKPKRPGSYSVTVEYVPSDGDHLGNTATAYFKVKR
jgi:hypothetical protein